MKVISGVLCTTNQHAASQFRFMFWDWLESQNYDVRHYWSKENPTDPRSECFVFKFRLIPKHLFNEYRRIWIGHDAIYRFGAHGTFTHREYSTGRNIDPYFVDAMKYAKEHAPCMIVVDSVAAMEMAFDHLRTIGKVYAMLVSTPASERIKVIQGFDQDSTRKSFLIVTKQLALCGWRLARSSVSLAATGMLEPEQAAQILGRTARMSMPHGRVEVTPRAFLKTKDHLDYSVEQAQPTPWSRLNRLRLQREKEPINANHRQTHRRRVSLDRPVRFRSLESISEPQVQACPTGHWCTRYFQRLCSDCLQSAS